MSKHYVIINDSGCVLRGFSDFFEQPNDSAICINEDARVHFELDCVINPPMTDYNGTPLYKLDGEQVVARTQEELDADKPVIVPIPTLEERTEALENAMLELIMGGIV